MDIKRAVKKVNKKFPEDRVDEKSAFIYKNKFVFRMTDEDGSDDYSNFMVSVNRLTGLVKFFDIFDEMMKDPEGLSEAMDEM